jgi:hypothetical protein
MHWHIHSLVCLMQLKLNLIKSFVGQFDSDLTPIQYVWFDLPNTYCCLVAVIVLFKFNDSIGLWLFLDKVYRNSESIYNNHHLLGNRCYLHFESMMEPTFMMTNVNNRIS